MEILAPAGNTQSLISAVRAGADAVYLGLKDFSARRNADNFSLSELGEAIRYCHIRDVKVYVAVNTMIKEKELPTAVRAVEDAFYLGADAFIVSDLGLISVLREILPEAPLHASTQMTVHSPAEIETLKKLGIKRVVLARELSRDKIREFCVTAKKENIEVEVFVHGALCMCVSGKCLLSSVLGGRSGNRGLCAGPCRLEFSSGSKGRHDLSLKDLSLVDYICELESLGVTSAKIEGRMKRPEYVAAAVSVCRAELEKENNENLKNALKNVFSRSGFTDGYYADNLGSDMFGIRTKEDAELSKTAFSYIHTLIRGERKSVPINIKAEIKADKPVSITLTDNRGNLFTVSGDIPETAQSKFLDTENIKNSLLKLGSTPYFAESVDILLDKNLFVPTAQINDLRRKAVEGLDNLRAYRNSCEVREYTPKNNGGYVSNEPKIYAEFQRAEQMPKNLSGISAVILPFWCDFPELDKSITKITALPRFIKDEKAVSDRLFDLKSEGVCYALCDNLCAVALAEKTGFKIITSIGFNCASRQTAEAIISLGAEKITLSAEAYMPSAKSIASSMPSGIFAYGRLPAMLTVNCPVKNIKTCKDCKGKSVLTDRKGISFPVTCNKWYSEVLNSAPLYLADKKDDLRGFDFLILKFTDETQKTAQRIINEYLCGGTPNGNFTRGLYYKDVL